MSYPGDTSPHNEAEGSRKKARTSNSALACGRCRSRKVKCNGQHPICGRCIKNPGESGCDYNAERGRQSYKEQNQILLDRILALESTLEPRDHPQPPSPAASPNDDGEDDDGARDLFPMTSIGTGSFTLGSDGSLFHYGHNSSFFRTLAVHLEERRDPALEAGVPSYLLPPYLPVSLSPSLHDEILELAFTRMSRFANPLDETSFLRDLHYDPTQRTAFFSRFLHLILLATGCRYLFVTPSFLGEHESRGLIFLEEARTLVDLEGESPKLSSVVGLLMLSAFMVGMGSDRVAWMYQGIAFMIAQDFQLDQDVLVHLPSLSPAELVVDASRRRTYWICSITTSFWSSYTGQASIWPYEVNRQPLPVVDIMDAAPETTFAWSAGLSKLAIKIVRFIYTTRGEKRRGGREVVAGKLNQELDEWYASRPAMLQLSGFTIGEEPSPDVLVLDLMHGVNSIVLNRPFLTSLDKNETTKASISRCRSSSAHIVFLLQYAKTTTYGQLGLPLNAQHAAFCAGTVLLLFAVGLGNDESSGSPLDQASRVEKAKVDLRIIISFLSDFASVWPAAKESSDALSALCFDCLLF